MSESHSSLGSVRRGRFCFCGERAIILTSRTDENPGRRFWRCRKYQTANDCDFFDWFEQDGKDIVIGRLRMKIATLNGTVTRLKKLNKLLLVFTVFLVVAFATIMLFIWGFVFFLGVVLGLRTVGVAGPSLEANDLTTVVLVLIGDRSGVGWDEAPAWGVGGGAVEVPAGWVEAGTGCGWVEGDGSGPDDVPVGHFLRLWPSCPQRPHLFLLMILCEDEDEAVVSAFGAESCGSVFGSVPASDANNLGHLRRLWPFFPQSVHFCGWPVLVTSSVHFSIKYILMSSIMLTMGFSLTSTMTLLNVSDILFNSASQRWVVLNRLLLQCLGGTCIRVRGFCSLPQQLLQGSGGGGGSFPSSLSSTPSSVSSLSSPPSLSSSLSSLSPSPFELSGGGGSFEGNCNISVNSNGVCSRYNSTIPKAKPILPNSIAPLSSTMGLSVSSKRAFG
ncbi:uncharacterized protein G2W53_034248 [Senna tora]|uniref:GRF-type domain-containing protein n=1 Tax=Senna tora TaxID=362788 RepID=A0A834T3S4_9FABA|nr:uncharacterized protein G2W53_034248 [Senna tora]